MSNQYFVLEGIITITVTMAYASFAVHQRMRPLAAIGAGFAITLGVDAARWHFTNTPTVGQTVFNAGCVLLGVWALSLVMLRQPDSIDERARELDYVSPWDDVLSPLDFGHVPFSGSFQHR